MKTKTKFFIFLLAFFLVFITAKTEAFAQDLPNTTLVYMQKGEAVKQVQIALNKLGYNVSTDASYGPNTRNAVLNFQKKYSSLVNDGSYGPKTRAVMEKALKGIGDIEDTRGSVGNTGNTSINLPNRSLRYLENSQDVKQVQISLNKLGFKLSTDGSYGPGTKAAVLTFQKRYSSLSNDGMYGPKTRAVMLEALNGKDSPNETGNPNDTVYEPGNTKIQTRGLVFNIGKSSDQVRLLKDFFRARKDSNVPGGYNYDNRTKQLVKDYQKLRGLKVDGIAGNLTMARINKEINDMSLKIGLTVPSVNIKGDIIIINKSSNTLYFIKNGVIQKSYPVATGKTSSLTPNGQFKIVVKYKNPRWGGAGVSAPISGGASNNPLGKRWMGISLRGGSVYGVHGNSEPNSIGTYASLGCVRMFNNELESLYEKVNINTPIWIGSETLLESYGVEFKSNYKK